MSDDKQIVSNETPAALFKNVWSCRHVHLKAPLTVMFVLTGAGKGSVGSVIDLDIQQIKEMIETGKWGESRLVPGDIGWLEKGLDKYFAAETKEKATEAAASAAAKAVSAPTLGPS